ncbi:hypothetical protein AYO44_16840 [Planctomycetaceae bacterium SCGC AG-212-F19]|nr:hypothetical protein AYO44_16840 [Planctomycetaceae bacterium SCGC AG-212-F19]
MSLTACSLCGGPIPDNPADPGDALSDEHVPALQFYPKSIRPELRSRLWKVPSHRRCNGSYQKDEDYFYHRCYPLVGVQNESMGNVILNDIGRRAKKPQSKAIIRQMLKECRQVSPGGIILPPGMIRVEYDVRRIQRVALKVGQCLFYRDHQRFMPRENCRHVELCEKPSNLQEAFALLVSSTDRRAVEASVFSYWHHDVDGLHSEVDPIV